MQSVACSNGTNIMCKKIIQSLKVCNVFYGQLLTVFNFIHFIIFVKDHTLHASYRAVSELQVK